jgi:hypothetical protein
MLLPLLTVPNGCGAARKNGNSSAIFVPILVLILVDKDRDQDRDKDWVAGRDPGHPTIR